MRFSEGLKGRGNTNGHLISLTLISFLWPSFCGRASHSPELFIRNSCLVRKHLLLVFECIDEIRPSALTRYRI